MHDLNVTPEHGKNFKQLPDGEQSRPAPHENGHLRLMQPEHLGRLRLSHLSPLKLLINCMGQLRLQKLLFWIGQIQICKYVTASSHDPLGLSDSHCHFSFAAFASRCCASANFNRRFIVSMSAFAVAMPFVDFFWKACSTYTASSNFTV